MDAAQLDVDIAKAESTPVYIPLTTLKRRSSTVFKKDVETYRDPMPDPIIPDQPLVATKADIETWLEAHIHHMDAPFAYLGDEPNTWNKDWDSEEYKDATKLCLVGSMSYLSSEGNLAIPLIYSQINHTRPNYVTERCFFPNSRVELGMFKDDKVSFFSIENKRPFRDFDILGFSVSYIMPFLHLAPMLTQSGIAPYALDRKQDDPIVLVGGCMSFVCEILAGGRGGVYDIAFIGESEDGFEEVCDEIMKHRKAGTPRREMLLDIQKRYGDRGIYCPQFYEVEYDKATHEIVRRVPLEEGIPERIKKAYVKDLNKGFMLTDPFISYAGGMAMGHLEIARGCSSACNFCQEGFNYRPYRERSQEVAVPAMKELMENVGSVDVVPASFTSSDHHEINSMIKQLLETVTDRVNIISQRADAFGLDPTFAWLTGMGGSKTVSVGMEGISQRMRDIMTKAISEDNLLRTTEFALRAGYQSIKYFMITNVPGTLDSDYEELLVFLDKVALLREKYNPRCEIKLSFTPLFISAFTPFQWHAITVDDRTLTPWIPQIKARGFGFRLGSGARFDEAYLSQTFHVADRRITSIMVDDNRDNNYFHFGTTPKGTVQRWDEHLAKKDLSFKWYFQEKHEDWNFSWDFVDNLTEKSALLSEYRRSRQAMGHLEPCINECYQCGACDTDTWQQRKGWAKAKKLDAEKVNVDDINVIRRSGMVQRARLRVQVQESHRYVEKDHWRLQVRRACYKMGIPIDPKTIAMASDQIKMLNWISGVDYVDLKLVEHLFDTDIFTSEEFNSHLHGMKVTDAKIYNDMKGMRTIQDLCLYELEVNKPMPDVEARIAWFLAQEVVTDEIPNDVPGKGKEGKVDRRTKSAFMKAHPTCGRIKKMGFKGVERVIVDFRAYVDDVWAMQLPDGKVKLRMLIRGEVSPYDFIQMLVKIRWKQGIGAPAARLEFLLAEDDGDQDSFLVPRCVESDRNIEQNLFGDPIHDDYCLRLQPWEDIYTHSAQSAP